MVKVYFVGEMVRAGTTCGEREVLDSNPIYHVSHPDVTPHVCISREKMCFPLHPFTRQQPLHSSCLRGRRHNILLATAKEDSVFTSGQPRDSSLKLRKLGRWQAEEASNFT
ncbi:hypothetical protein SETIT_3G348100v2 [Setaria italica]|uniref:Uncharacterized protein n=1 Tax=Setaria italica TaxID=4555 RepID=A0A368QMF3_SETIT|nr:hypothetical protein SETIT_3G348100v2 [Setaria italica]